MMRPLPDGSLALTSNTTSRRVARLDTSTAAAVWLDHQGWHAQREVMIDRNVTPPSRCEPGRWASANARVQYLLPRIGDDLRRTMGIDMRKLANIHSPK